MLPLPLGTISNWVGKNRRPLTLAPEHCLECRLCATACPAAALTFADDRATAA